MIDIPSSGNGVGSPSALLDEKRASTWNGPNFSLDEVESHIKRACEDEDVLNTPISSFSAGSPASASQPSVWNAANQTGVPHLRSLSLSMNRGHQGNLRCMSILEHLRSQSCKTQSSDVSFARVHVPLKFIGSRTSNMCAVCGCPSQAMFVKESPGCSQGFCSYICFKKSADVVH